MSFSAKIPEITLDCYEVEIIDYMEKQFTFDKAIKIFEWHVSMVDELNFIHKNRTWTWVKIRRGAKSITCKWVFRLKENQNGSTFRFKSRVVGRGF